MRKILLGVIGLLFAIPVFAACPSGQVEQTYTSATGTVTQNGTPSPDNPIEPIFYQQGDMILRKINDTYADSYDATTGKITRRVGVKVLDGTEDGWILYQGGQQYKGIIYNEDIIANNKIGAFALDILSTHFYKTDVIIVPLGNIRFQMGAQGSTVSSNRLYLRRDVNETVASFKDYLAQQYANGTPVTVYYPLATETTEDWAAEQCTSSSPIKIATTAYNAARFSPVVTELNNTIATIRSVVTNTINQTKAIADLQATKQTRPDETCPAGKKCLLVEDNDGHPHWYEIIENAYGLPNGYTALEYIENTDSQYINTGITVNSGTTVIATFQGTDDDKGAVFGYDQDYIGTMMQCYNGKWRVNNTTTDLPCTTKATVDITWTDDTSGRHVSTATINGITVPAYTNSRTYRTLMLFQGNGWNDVNNYWTGGKIYSLSITQNNTLVRNFVPARNSSGVIGMYDLVSGQFFTNKGTGTFVAGPEI